jgi:RimJ/RimL family protein N-acetyltransferase
MQQYRTGPETARLRHRAFTVEDAEALFALNGNPEVMRYTGEPLLTFLDAARRAIEFYPDFETVGYGRWACVLKETQELLCVV